MRLLSLTLGFSLLAAPAAATDLFVPGDSSTVAGALALAASGDRVYVGPGTYTERITVPGGVGLYGAGPEIAILDGGGGGTVVTIGGDGAVVSGFSIRNAGGTHPAYGVDVPSSDASICGNLIYWNFRGVWVEGASDTFVQWNVSADNEDDGLDGVSATAVFRGNTVVSNGNAAISDGDIGIYLLSVQSRVISENIVVHNNEYGIWCDGQTSSENNDVWNHQDDFTSCGSSPTDFSADPLFVSFSDDNDPRNDDFHLQAGSPAADVISVPPLDADGSDRDLGAFGGQGYDGGPRPAWSARAEVSETTLDAAETGNVVLAVGSTVLDCDHGVNRVEISLPGFLVDLLIDSVAVGGLAASYTLGGSAGLWIVELDETVASGAPILVGMSGAIRGDAAGTQTVGVRVGHSAISAWRPATAGDGDAAGPITTGTLDITANELGGDDDDDDDDDDDSTGDDDDATGDDDDDATGDDDDATTSDDDDTTDGGRRSGGCSCATQDPSGSPWLLAVLVATVSLMRRPRSELRQG